MDADTIAAVGALLGGIGGLLGGGAAVAAIVVAWLKGPQELRRWRTHKREEKRAESAGQVMGASLRMLSALRRLTVPVAWAASTTEKSVDENSGADEGQPSLMSMFPEVEETKRKRDALELEFDERWRLVEADLRLFYDAMDLAQTYLTQEAIDCVMGIEDLVRDVRGNQSILPQVYGDAGMSSIYERALGPGPKKKIEQLRAQLLTVVRPLAQLEDMNPAGSANADRLASHPIPIERSGKAAEPVERARKRRRRPQPEFRRSSPAKARVAEKSIDDDAGSPGHEENDELEEVDVAPELGSKKKGSAP